MSPATRDALVVGASGALGGAVAARLVASGHHVLTSSRTGLATSISLDSSQPEDARRQVLSQLPVLDVVVFAHGDNDNDSIGSLQLARAEALMEVNVQLIVETLDALVATEGLRRGARLVVLSSIWQDIARPGKFSYTVSKAAIGGLVRAAAADLAAHQVLINAVLPGVVDTPMTRRALSPEVIDSVRDATGFGRLVSPESVAATVEFLCSPSNTGITGQSINVDLGFSVVRPL